MLLSLCIPTYNRSDILKNTIDSIVSQKIFQETDKVEIVVSDNASTDSTGSVVQDFIKKYQSKIRYLRLEKNIDAHLNFENVLKNGSGDYIKLLADSTCYNPGMLDHFVADLENFYGKDAVITLGIPHNDENFKEISSVAEALTYSSFQLTWISSYCFKREKFLLLPEPFRFKHLYFPHVDILFRLLKANGNAIVMNRNYYNPQQRTYAANRNEAYIFGNCYLQLLKFYNDDIPKSLFKKEKYNVLLFHIVPVFFDASHLFFQRKNPGYRVFWNSLPDYHKDFYFIILFPLIICYYELRKISWISQFLAKMKNKFFRFFYKGSAKESFFYSKSMKK